MLQNVKFTCGKIKMKSKANIDEKNKTWQCVFRVSRGKNCRLHSGHQNLMIRFIYLKRWEV